MVKVGDDLWLFLDGRGPDHTPLAAKVTRVWPNGTVNIAAWSENGTPLIQHEMNPVAVVETQAPKHGHFCTLPGANVSPWVDEVEAVIHAPAVETKAEEVKHE